MEATVENARRFHQKWNRWPMEGGLGPFAEQGLVEWSPGAEELTILRPPAPEEVEDARHDSVAAFHA